MSNFTKICLPGAKLMHADRQTQQNKEAIFVTFQTCLIILCLLLYIYFSSGEVIGNVKH